MKDVIEKDPEALKKAKKIYSMFGSFYMGYDGGPLISAEWNVRGDEEASKVFTTCGAEIHYAGLDVTTLVKLRGENRKKLLKHDTPLTNALNDLYPLWRTLPYAGPDPTLFDVVAVGMVLWPELFTFRPAYVKVIDGGYTVIDESKESNGMVGMSINMNTFLDRFMERMLKQELRR
jgi:inosine-uridine nucleoside N-ribohydrolase